MKFYEPLWMCGYLLGVFPYTLASSSPCDRFRLHWFGVAFKALHVALFWSSAASVAVIMYQPLVGGRIQKLNKKLATTSPLNVDELFVYMTYTTCATAAVCQVQMTLPSVVTLAGECLLQRRRRGTNTVAVRGVWQWLSALTIVGFVAFELAMYYVLFTLRCIYVWSVLLMLRNHCRFHLQNGVDTVDLKHTYILLVSFQHQDEEYNSEDGTYNDSETFKQQYFICLFPFLSNIDCIVVEQFFYIMCLTLYLRLQHLHEDITNLVHKAEYPRWKCWVNPTAGGPARLGIPAFSVSDIRDLRNIHLRAMEMFLRVNHSFQLPLLLNMLDSIFRIVVYTSELSYHLANGIWNKNMKTSYARTTLYSGYCIIRIVRLWYLHSCEYYITKKIMPIRVSLSWLTLTLNPVTSRRLMPEIILFQNQLDAISSKFKMYGMININMAFFYAGFGLLIAYVIFLLQFLGSSMPPSKQLFNNYTMNANFLKNYTTAAIIMLSEN